MTREEKIKKDFDYIDYIQKMRSENNVLWMEILRIALWYAPDETKRVLKQIKANDVRITEATGRIAEDENS